MRIDIFRDFITPAECRELADWAIGHEGSVLIEPQMKEGAWQPRRTSRNTPKSTYQLPDLAYDIQNRIRGLFVTPVPRTAPNGGKDGIIVINTHPGGETVDHFDPQPVPGIDVLRANVIVQSAEAGGELNVEGQSLDVGQGDLHLYNVCQLLHGVRKIGGTRPRVIWLFGFCIDRQDWDSGRIQVQRPAC